MQEKKGCHSHHELRSPLENIHGKGGSTGWGLNWLFGDADTGMDGCISDLEDKNEFPISYSSSIESNASHVLSIHTNTTIHHYPIISVCSNGSKRAPSESPPEGVRVLVLHLHN